MKKYLAFIVFSIFALVSSVSAMPMCIDVFNHLDVDTRHKLEKAVTKNNVDLNLVLRSGYEQKDSEIGCYFGDAESYQVFRPLVNGIVKKYHAYEANGKLAKDFDLTSLKEVNLDPKGEYIISTRVRVARSLSDYPFMSAISRDQRKALEARIVTILDSFTGDLKGKYYPLDTMSPEEKTRLIATHMLFKTEDRFLESAQISRDMPDARGIFYSTDKQFIVWVNEEDHLRIIALNKGADIIAVFNKMFRALDIIDKKLQFAFDKDFGYLNSCPTNIGTAIRASVHIRLPKISKQTNFKQLCDSLGLSVRGIHGEHSGGVEGIYDISNKQRLGKSEKELVEQLINGIKVLIKLERTA